MLTTHQSAGELWARQPVPRLLHFLPHTGNGARPRLGSLNLGGQRFDRRLSGCTSGKAAIGHHIQRLTLENLLEVAVLAAVLTYKRLGIGLHAGSQHGSEYHYFKKLLQGKPLYVVTYGSFASHAAAQASIKALPAKAQAAKPWPRSIASVRQEMK